MTDLPDFLRPLEKVACPFPADAVREAIARREESTPYLLEALEWVSTHGDDVPEDYLLHEYALRILAKFRDPRAHAPLIRLARHPMADDLLGDTISGDLGQAMAATCGGDTQLIRELIADMTVDDFVRAAGFRALGTLCRAGELPRETLSDYLGGLFASQLGGGEEFFGTALADICAQFGFTEHLEKVRTAFDDGFVDPFFDEWRHLEKRLKSGVFDESEASHWRMIEDPVEEMSYWHCFTPEAALEEEASPDDECEDDSDDDNGGDDVFLPSDQPGMPSGPRGPQPPIQAGPKPGRNEPCPCGSGRKFKRCCGVRAVE